MAARLVISTRRPNSLAQFAFHLEMVQDRPGVIWTVEADQHVDVTRRPEVRSQDRAEQGQFRYPPALAERANGALVGEHARVFDPCVA